MRDSRRRITGTLGLLVVLLVLWLSTPQSPTQATSLSPRRATAGWEGRWNWYGRQATVILWNDGTLEWKVE